MMEKSCISEVVRMLLRDAPIVSDSGFYWIQYVPFIIPFIGDVKFICLMRDKQETVDSFCRHGVAENLTPEGNNFNHSLPKYDLPKREAVSKYFDEYYDIAASWQTSYPYNFRIFFMDALNSEEGQREMLSFAGFESPRFQVGIRLNRGEK
jgi:hypothetical protein